MTNGPDYIVKDTNTEAIEQQDDALDSIPYPENPETIAKKEEKRKKENLFWQSVRNNDFT